MKYLITSILLFAGYANAHEFDGRISYKSAPYPITNECSEIFMFVDDIDDLGRISYVFVYEGCEQVLGPQYIDANVTATSWEEGERVHFKGDKIYESSWGFDLIASHIQNEGGGGPLDFEDADVGMTPPSAPTPLPYYGDFYYVNAVAATETHLFTASNWGELGVYDVQTGAPHQVGALGDQFPTTYPAPSAFDAPKMHADGHHLAAYIPTENKVKLYNILSPENPVYLYEFYVSNVNELQIDNGLLYVATDTELETFDISLAHPLPNSVNLTCLRSMKVTGSRIYLVTYDSCSYGQYYGSSKVRILSTADYSQLAQWQGSTYGGYGEPKLIEANAQYAYVLDSYGDFHVLDATNAVSPIQLGGTYSLYEADEIFYMNRQVIVTQKSYAITDIINVSNGQVPLSQVTVFGGGYLHGAAANSENAFFARYSNMSAIDY